MADEPIGSVSVKIEGDYSPLVQAFQQSQSLATAAGKDIADALVQGASATQNLGTEISGQLAQIGPAAAQAAASLEPFEAKVEELVASGSTLAEAIAQATEAMNAEAPAAGAAGDAMGGLAGSTDEAAGATDEFAGAAGAAGTAALQLSEGAKAIFEAQQEADAELAKAQGILTEVQAAYENGQASANDLARAQKGVEEASREANPALHESASATQEFVTEALKIVGIAASLETLKEWGLRALEIAADQEKLVISLTALTGSAQTAREALAGIEELSFKDALDIDTVEKVTQRMVAFGMSTTQAMHAMQAAADAAAATGAEFETVSNSLTNMSKSGMAGSRQLIQLGLSLDDLSRTLGVAREDVKETFAAMDETERMNALTTALEKFGGTGAAVAAGLSGDFKNLQNDIHNLFESSGADMAVFAQALIKLGDIQIKATSIALRDFGEDLKNIGQSVELVAESLGLMDGPLKSIVGLLKDTAWPEFFANVGKSALPIMGIVSALSNLLTVAQTIVGVNPKVKEMNDLLAENLNSQAKQLTNSQPLIDSVAKMTDKQLALRDATSGTNTEIERAAVATHAFVAPLDEAVTAADMLRDAELGHKAQVDALALSYGMAIDKVHLAARSYEDAQAAGKDLTNYQITLKDAVDNESKAWSKLQGAIGDFNKLAEKPPDLAKPTEAMHGYMSGVLEDLKKWVPAAEALPPHIKTLQDDFNELGLKVDDVTGKVGNQQIAAFEDLQRHSDTTLEAVQTGWSKISGAVNKLAQVDMPGAIRAYDSLIAQLIKEGAAHADVQAAIASKLDMEIRYASQTGTDATAQIIALQGIREQQQLNADKATFWGKNYADALGLVHSAFETLGKDIADNIVDGKSWHDVWQGFLKSIEKEILEQLIGSAFKLLGDEVTNLIGKVTGISTAAGQAAKAATDSAGAAVDAIGAAGKTAASTVSSTASAASSAVTSTVASTVTAIASVVGAIGSVVGAIATMRTEGTLNAIEHSTRYTQIILDDLGQQVFWPMFENTGYMVGTLNDISTHINAELATQQTWLPLLGDIVAWLGVIDADLGGSGVLAPSSAPAAPSGTETAPASEPSVDAQAQTQQQAAIEALRKLAEEAEAAAAAHADDESALAKAILAADKLAATTGAAADIQKAAQLETQLHALQVKNSTTAMQDAQDQLTAAQQQATETTNDLTAASTTATTSLYTAGTMTIASAGDLSQAAVHLESAAKELHLAVLQWTGGTAVDTSASTGSTAASQPKPQSEFPIELQERAWNDMVASLTSQGLQVPSLSIRDLLPGNIQAGQPTAQGATTPPAAAGQNFDLRYSNFHGVNNMDDFVRQLRSAGARF